MNSTFVIYNSPPYLRWLCFCIISFVSDDSGDSFNAIRRQSKSQVLGLETPPHELVFARLHHYPPLTVLQVHKIVVMMMTIQLSRCRTGWYSSVLCRKCDSLLIIISFRWLLITMRYIFTRSERRMFVDALTIKGLFSGNGRRRTCECVNARA
jgi:hypothetical protein